VDKLVGLPETAKKTFTYVTKVTGATAGAAGVEKGTVDFLKVLAYQNEICAIVSAGQ
jgi:hypothetical protein